MLDRIVRKILKQLVAGRKLDLEQIIAANPKYEAVLRRRLRFVAKVAGKVRRQSRAASSRRRSREGQSESTLHKCRTESSTLPPNAPSQIDELVTRLPAPQPPGDRRVQGRSRRVIPTQGIGRSACSSEADGQLRSFVRTLFPGSRRQDRLGRFELRQLVGQGGFGLVFQAYDPELERLVAIKVPRPGRQPADESERDFLREARYAASLKHPRVVSVHEVGCDRGLPFIVSDFIEGTSLAQLLTQRELSQYESAEVVAQAAEALEGVHQGGIVHRDVKPGNLLIDSQGRVHLTDFGLAQRLHHPDASTKKGSQRGTMSFHDQDVQDDAPRILDGRADVFNLGIVLYRLLTGVFPFRGSQAFFVHQIVHLHPPRPQELQPLVPTALEVICLRALAKTKGRRFPSAAAMAAALRNWQEPKESKPFNIESREVCP